MRDAPHPTPPGRPRWLYPLLIALAALLVRGGGVVALNLPQEGDYPHYLRMASGVAQGRGLVDGYGNRAFYSAGYPLLLAGPFRVFGASANVAGAVNVALGVASALLVYALAATVLGSRRVALLAGVLWLAYLEAAIYTEYAAKENLMTPLMLAVLLLAARYRASRRRAAIAAGLGVLMGCLALVGTAAVVLAPIVALAIVLCRERQTWARRVAHLALVGVLGLAVLAPWLHRNKRVLGKTVLNTNGGFNLYLGNNPAADGFFVSVRDTPLGPRWAELRRERGELGADAECKRLAIEHIREHPGRTARLALRKLWLFWSPPLHRLGEGGLAARSMRVGWLIQYVALMVLSAASLAWAKRDARRLWPLWAATALYAALHMIFYVVFRYRLPIMPMICILAARGLAGLWRRYGPNSLSSEDRHGPGSTDATTNSTPVASATR